MELELSMFENVSVSILNQIPDYLRESDALIKPTE